jgi:hypothetical protein
VIGYDDVLPLFFGACPSFAVSGDAASHDDRDGHFVHVARFVSHLIRLLEEGCADAFPPCSMSRGRCYRRAMRRLVASSVTASSAT